MNLFTLILKQMKQRLLASTLTILMVTLVMALAASVLIAYRQSESLFGQTSFGYNLLIGVRGSKIGLVMNTVYGMDVSQGNIPYSVYDNLKRNGREYGLRSAVPFMVGDAFKGNRIMAVGAEMFGLDSSSAQPIDANITFRYDATKSFTFAQGKAFHPRKFEAVIGSEAARESDIKMGDKIWLEHGGQATDIHDERWTVVGILDKTNTAMDRTIFIPLLTGYAVPEHEHALVQMSEIGAKAQPLIPDAGPAPETPSPELPKVVPHDHDGDGKSDHTDAEHDHAATTKSAVPHDHEGDGKSDHTDADHDHAATTKSAVPHDHDGDGKSDHTDAEHDHAATTKSAVPHDHDGDGKSDHAAHEHHDHDHEKSWEFIPGTDGEISVRLPKDEWQISGIFVRTVSQGNYLAKLHYDTNFDQRSTAMAVYPPYEMRQFFDRFLTPATLVLLGICVLASVIAAMAILVSIYNSIVGRRREIAIMRALGATRTKILLLVCLEAVMIGVVGAVLGVVVGHVIAFVGASYAQARFGGSGFSFGLDPAVVYYALGIVVLAFLAGLVPALKAYETPVADNLVTE
jgi:putative ABC transport system permease protein